jgi:hypothetical protein
MVIFDDVPTASEARAAKKHIRELTSYKINLSVTYGGLTTNLEHVPHLEGILQDINRPYMKNATHLHGWQFFLLTDHLKDLIEWLRLHPDGTRPAINLHKKCKMDHYHCLY